MGASGIALFAALLTRRWSKALHRRLLLAGLLTICITFIANLSFHKDGSLLGVLLPLGYALFSWLVGTEIWQRLQVRSEVAVTTQTE